MALPALEGLLSTGKITQAAYKQQIQLKGWAFDHCFHLSCLASYLNDEQNCPGCEREIEEISSLRLLVQGKEYVASQLSPTEIWRICQIWRRVKTNKPPTRSGAPAPISHLSCAMGAADHTLVLQVLERLDLEDEDIYPDLDNCLLYAIRHKQFDILDVLIKSCIQPRRGLSDSYLVRALQFVIQEDKLPLFKIIVENMTSPGAAKQTILHTIISEDRHLMLKEIFNHDHFTFAESDLEFLLSQIVEKKKFWALKSYIEAYLCPDPLREKIIRAAVYYQDIEALEILFSGSEHLLKEEFLFQAIEIGNSKLVCYLYEQMHIINPKSRTEDQFCKMLDRAVSENKIEVLRSLITEEIVNSVLIEGKEDERKTCQDFWDIVLITAAEAGNKWLIYSLQPLKIEFAPEVFDRAMLNACLSGTISTLEALKVILPSSLKDDSSWWLKTISKAEIESALVKTIQRGSPDSLDFLLKSLPPSNEKMKTLLTEAVEQKQSSCVQVLLNESREVPSCGEMEVLFLTAIQSGHKETFRVLLANWKEGLSLDFNNIFESIILSERDDMLCSLLRAAGSRISTEKRISAMKGAIARGQTTLMKRLSTNVQLSGEEISLLVTQTLQNSHPLKVKSILLDFLLETISCLGELNLDRETIGQLLAIIAQQEPEAEKVLKIVSRLFGSKNRTAEEWDHLMGPLLTKAISGQHPYILWSLLSVGQLSAELRGKCIEQAQQSTHIMKTRFIESLRSKQPLCEESRQRNIYAFVTRCYGKARGALCSLGRSLKKAAYWVSTPLRRLVSRGDPEGGARERAQEA
jgi:hypothetical protein